MKRIITFLLALTLAVGLLACGKTEEPEKTEETSGLQVGYAKELITPNEPVPLNGYGNNQNRMHNNTLDHLYVTCVAFKDGDETLLWIAQDLLNTEPATYDVFDRVALSTGVDRNRVMVCSSHTHSGPDTNMPSHPAISSYLSTVYYPAVIKAAQNALKDLQPAQLYGASTTLEGMNFVRHYIMNDGTYSGPNFGSSASGYKSHATENDGEMRLVKIEREGDNKDILIMNWGAHPTMTGGVDKYDLSADYVGAIRNKIERDAGMHFAFFQAAGGNQVVDSWITEEKHNMDYVTYGEKLAQIAMDLMPAMTKIEGEGIETIKVDMEAEVNHDDVEYIAEALQVNALHKAGQSRDVCNAKARELGLSSVYHANAIVARTSRKDVDILHLDAVRIGGMAFITSQYEMFSDHSHYIKDKSPFEMMMISTSSNGDAVYIPTIKAYEYGCYESYVSYFARGTGEAAADKYIEMLNTLKEGA